MAVKRPGSLTVCALVFLALVLALAMIFEHNNSSLARAEVTALLRGGFGISATGDTEALPAPDGATISDVIRAGAEPTRR